MHLSSEMVVSKAGRFFVFSLPEASVISRKSLSMSIVVCISNVRIGNHLFSPYCDVNNVVTTVVSFGLTLRFHSRGPSREFSSSRLGLAHATVLQIPVTYFGQGFSALSRAP